VLSSVEIDSILGVYYSAGWTVGRRNVIVGYEHGLDRPPERIRRGGLLLLKRWLVEGPVDDRTTSMSNDDGTFSLATPGRGGSIFGLPELDAAIRRRRTASAWPDGSSDHRQPGRAQSDPHRPRRMG
jgi:hypothetical protein